MQLDHHTSNFKIRKFPITLVCDNITSAANIGSIFRLADAFGVEKIIFSGTEPTFSRRTEKTARATHKIIPFEFIEDSISTVLDLKKNGHLILALEITTNSIPIQHLKITGEQPIVLILGNENFGVSQNFIEIADSICHIEMFGNNSSMNIAQATGICLYELTKYL
ncbi:TrmH family RNA methyltransferase [Galbibacter sp. BG1]|uniref:TrmH family RNA methyltransferase n=1 Tax=Galbibacter sp. BG1 TaxID=1170699 RepID=UPI0015B829D6|nr:TrmH family RNA methyltransferase [Galbibacter sp. BG1]QLE03029.1 TrmH family RNA methyltransferase [Galbibacter sp. BG1]